jgi:antitoxin component YwqK of YwqJK toxin-antitoxin module
MISKIKFIFCVIVVGVILYAQATPASSCRDYVRDVNFLINQGPDNSGNCRMEKSGEYPPESVPFRKREGKELCYRSGRILAEYQWANGKRKKGLVHLTDATKVELPYKDTHTVTGSVKITREGKLLCSIPVVANSISGLVHEYHPNGRLAYGFRLKNGQEEKGMVAFEADGSLQKFECAEKPLFEGDENRCGFAGKPATISVAGQSGSDTITMTHLKGQLIEQSVVYSSGYKEVIKYPEPGRDIFQSQEFYPNGRLKSSFTVKERQLEGEKNNYYENGQLSSAVIYKEGIPQATKQYYMNGQLKIVILLNQEESLRSVTRYYQSGVKEREGTYKARKNGEVNWDIPHGNFRFYESDGRLEREGAFVNGEKNGIHIFYEPSGEKLKVKYSKDKPEKFEKYDRSGNLISQGNIFEDGSIKETLKKFNQI